MDQLPYWRIIESHAKKFMIILFALIILPGCAPRQNENLNVDLANLKAGETVYVCGCPEMCCNSISKDPNGRCACNYPLKPGIISRIQDGMIYVKVSGLEKVFSITNNTTF